MPPRLPRRRTSAIGGAARVALALLGVGAAIAVDPASAAIRWTTPTFGSEATTISAARPISDGSSQTAIASNDRGDSVAGWISWVPGTVEAPGRHELQVTRRTAGSAWAPPIVVTQKIGVQFKPELGIDANGVATVVWSEASQFPFDVRAATLTAAGLGPIQTFSSAVGSTFGPSLEVSPSGRAVLAFASAVAVGAEQRSNRRIAVVRRTSPTGAFGEPEFVSSTADGVVSDGPAAAINESGETVVAFHEEQANGARQVRVARAPAGGSFGASVGVSAGTYSGYPEIVLDEQGNATVAWQQNDGGAPYKAPHSAHARRVARDGALGPDQILQADAQEFVNPQLAVAPDGSVTAGWNFSGVAWGAPAIKGAVAAPGADFGPPSTLDARGGTEVVAVAADKSGAGAVAWQNSGAMVAATHAPGQTEFATPAPIEQGKTDYPSAAFGADGRLSVAYSAQLADTWVVRSALSSPGVSSVADEPPTSAARIQDTTKPVLILGAVSKVQSPRKHGKRRPAPRLVVNVRASEDSTVRVRVSKKGPGVLKGKGGICAKRPKNAKVRKGKSCTYWAPVGPEIVAPIGKAGATMDFGKFPGAGTYAVTATGADAAGNQADRISRTLKLR